MAKKKSTEEILYENKLFEFIEEEKEYNIDSTKRSIKRSFVRRPPGVRAIIINEKKEILLSKEYRYELENYDYRLPGGKVFDSIKDYRDKIDDDILEYAIKTVKKEIKEEVGISINNPKLYTISRAGASVVWDLYYFIINDYKIIDNGQDLEDNEIIDGFVWKSFDEVIKMCINKDIHEERTIGVLLSYILKERM